MVNKKATDRKIRSVWTLEYKEVGENQIEIINFSREDEEGYEKETQLDSVVLEEDEDRNVIGAWIGDNKHKEGDFRYNVKKEHLIHAKHFKVVNVKYVFDYN